MRLHYLEIVTPEVEAMCAAYEGAHEVAFGESDALLGGARTARLPDGTTVGVRGPLRETEQPIVRPYWLVQDIQAAVEELKARGAQIAMNPTELPSRGTFALYIQGGIEQGLWQL